MPPRRPRRDTKRKNFRGKRNFKRFPKKKAYAPKNKRRFINKSNPIAENKQVEAHELSTLVGNNPDGSAVLVNMSAITAPAAGHPMNSIHYTFIPDSACYQTHGLDEHQMVGRSVYQRMCAAKFLIKWPQSTMNTGIEYDTQAGSFLMGAIPDQSMSYKLYWGYVPIKHLLTGYTDPLAVEASAFKLEQRANQRIADYFDSRADRISFIPKRTATIKIIGSKVLNAPNYNLGRLATSTKEPISTTVDGNIADTLVKVTWPINKKIHLEPSNKFAWDSNTSKPVATSTGATVFYRNYDHIPFAVVVSWSHNKLPIDDTSVTPTDGNLSEFQERYARTMRVPHVLINDLTYYRDS